MSLRLSIIVPVYNVEPYLESCLQSIVTQSLSPSDYEVLVINDGSPDGCAAILDRYAKGIHKSVPYIKKIKECQPLGMPVWIGPVVV